MAVATLDNMLQEAVGGRRLTPDEAVRLYRETDLLTLGQAAQSVRFQRHPERRVTYLIDRNINYSNVCITDCHFCAFYRPSEEHPEAYTLSRDVIAAKMEELLQAGGTRILMQGGHHPGLPLAWYEELLRWLRATYPEAELNCFSPSEIDHIAQVEGCGIEAVLRRLQAAGLAGLPGGGAEMLDDDIRMRVSPKKQSAAGWLEVMRVAQRLGLATTATMVIGFGETVEQRIGHLAKIRDLQDASLHAHGNGFGAFIAWTLQIENTSLGAGKERERYGASAHDYLRTVAVARLFLDNVEHLQASWPTQGTRLAQVALEFGCDDFGSTMMEENVVSAAGTSLRNVAEINLQRHIHAAGFTPAQRDTRYNIVRVIERVPEPAAPRRAPA
ncbi:MAG: dehypoxanthine futalosine cyclase [Candidatus Latescibacterota bacterium]|nr:MAG: dehypoxanthine futalosine cyclase [Candidatus Latescibacterota bacterium]